MFSRIRNNDLNKQSHQPLDLLNEMFQINGSESLGELLDIVCHLTEFQEFKLRPTDRRVLNELNGSGGVGVTHESNNNKRKGRVAMEATEIEGGPLLRFPVLTVSGSSSSISSVPMKISWLIGFYLFHALRSSCAIY